MMGRRMAHRCGCVRSLASVLIIVAGASTARADEDAAGPAWLRAPLTRGPVAATLGIDTNHAWWGIDGALPLSLGPRRGPVGAPTGPVLGLGLSIAGQGGSNARGLRYSAIVDRRHRDAGAWLGLSTGGRGQGVDTRLQIGTGLWRSLARIDMEVGVASSFVGYQEPEASHWGFWRNTRDTLHWRDTTTYQNVDRSGLWHTAQSALRWRHGRVELTAIGGVTVGPRIEPRRWAQAALNVHASRRVMVMAAYGQRSAASMAFDPSARPQTMVGIQLAPWSPRESAVPIASVPRVWEWRVSSAGDGRTRIRVRCPGATRVEIAGDFTDWAPVALNSANHGQWETRLEILPGLHQVQVRVDGGEWQVPPGLMNTQSEFAGAAGVLLIE